MRGRDVASPNIYLPGINLLGNPPYLTLVLFYVGGQDTYRNGGFRLNNASKTFNGIVLARTIRENRPTAQRTSPPFMAC